MKDIHSEHILVFKALAVEIRLKIVDMLSRDSDEICACKILDNLDITQPTLSYHMKILCDSGLVKGRREGAWMRYSLNRGKIDDIKQLFTDVVKGAGIK